MKSVTSVVRAHVHEGVELGRGAAASAFAAQAKADQEPSGGRAAESRGG